MDAGEASASSDDEIAPYRTATAFNVAAGADAVGVPHAAPCAPVALLDAVFSDGVASPGIDASPVALLSVFASFLRHSGLCPDAASALEAVAADNPTRCSNGCVLEPPRFFNPYGCVLLACTRLGAADVSTSHLHLSCPDA